MKWYKYFVFYFFFFLLLFFEDSVYIFGLTLSNIWKSIIILSFGLFVVYRKILFGVEKIDFILFFLFLSFVLNFYGFIPFSDIEELLLLFVLPISYFSFYFLFTNDYITLKNIILSLAIFFIISGIPFLLEILESVSQFTDARENFASSYQFEGSLLVGFFKHPALSSIIFVFSTVIVWFLGFRESKSFRLLFFFICFLGCYEVFRAFTRTGWVLLSIFPFAVLYFNKEYSKIKKTSILFMTLLVIMTIYNSNEVIQNRVIGERENNFNQSTDKLSNVTSGRDLIIISVIQNVINKGKLAVVFGLGREKSLEQSNGVVAHNRFVEIFSYGGLFSLFMYLFFLMVLFREILMRKSKSKIFVLAISLYVMMILSLFPSHGLPLYADVLFGGIIAMNRIHYKFKLKKAQYEYLRGHKSKFI